MRRAALLVSVIVSGLLAGCGSSDDSSSRSSTQGSQKTISEGEFVKRAEARCTDFNATIARILKSTNAVADVPDVYEGFLQHLQALQPPDNAKSRAYFRAAFGYVEDYEEIEEAVIAARGTGNPDLDNDNERGESDGSLKEARKSIAQGRASYLKASRAYGFKACAKIVDHPLVDPGISG